MRERNGATLFPSKKFPAVEVRERDEKKVRHADPHAVPIAVFGCRTV
jgi:hypothetical protein